MIGKNALLEFFKISPTPSLVLCPDLPKFTIIEVNEAYLKATQSKREDLVGKGIFEAFPDNDSDTTADGVKNLTLSLNTVIKTLKKHQMAVQKYDIPIRGTSEFELKFWEPENIPLFTDDGQLTFIIHCVIDVTERKKAEDNTTTANDRFSSIFNFSPVAISITDASDGRFIQVNDAFCQTTGFKREYLIGKKSVDVKIIEPDTREKLITHVVNQGSSSKDVEGTIKKQNGEIVEILYRVEKIEIDSKPCFVSALIDITSRKKTERGP